MLESISWREFATGVGVITGAYYFIVILLLYSTEIIAMIKRQWTKSHVSVASDPITTAQPRSYMGDIRRERVESLASEVSVSTEDILVSEPRLPDEPIEIVSVTVSIEDEIANLSSEIEALARIVSHSSRDESLPLFQSLISRYSSLVDTDHVEPLSRLLHDKVAEHCDFDIEVDEIRGWWSMADERMRHKSK